MSKIDRRAVYERDAGICQLCGESVAWADFEVDHKVPQSAHGSHAFDNLQTAHVVCNRRKGCGSLVRDGVYPFVTHTQAAILLGIDRQEVRRLVKRGVLNSVRHVRRFGSGTLRIPLEDVERALGDLVSRSSAESDAASPAGQA